MDTVITVGGDPAAAPVAAPTTREPSRPAEGAERAERLARILRSLGFRDPLLLGRTVERLLADPAMPADAAAAAAQVERRAALWFAALLDETPDERTAAAGRAAFLLAGAAQRWPDAFLAPGEPPAALVAALRRAVPVAVPEPLPGAMIDQSLDWSSPLALVRRLFGRGERKVLSRSA